MRITMRTTSAGPDGCRFPDKTYDVPRDEALELIKAGAAVEAEAAPKAAKPKPKDEDEAKK